MLSWLIIGFAMPAPVASRGAFVRPLSELVVIQPHPVFVCISHPFESRYVYSLSSSVFIDPA